VTLTTKQRDISANRLQRIHPSFSKSVRSLLRYRNSAIATSFSLNLALKSTAVLPRSVADSGTASLLPVICKIAGDVFVFQQDNAPTHRAHDMVVCLRHETPHDMTCGQLTLLT